jgi:hypothetical protein
MNKVDIFRLYIVQGIYDRIESKKVKIDGELKKEAQELEDCRMALNLTLFGRN